MTIVRRKHVSDEETDMPDFEQVVSSVASIGCRAVDLAQAKAIGMKSLCRRPLSEQAKA